MPTVDKLSRCRDAALVSLLSSRGRWRLDGLTQTGRHAGRVGPISLGRWDVEGERQVGHVTLWPPSPEQLEQARCLRRESDAEPLPDELEAELEALDRMSIPVLEPRAGNPWPLVVAGFDLWLMREGEPSHWVAQGDLARQLQAQGGALVISSLSVDHFGLEVSHYRGRLVSYQLSTGGVTGEVLRQIPLGWLYEAAQVVQSLREAPDPASQQLVRLLAWNDGWFGDEVADTVQSVPGRRPGRPPRKPEQLRHVAELVLNQGPAPGVHKRIAAKLGIRPETVRDQVAAARRAGWLAPTIAGRRMAAPGPLLQRAWERES